MLSFFSFSRSKDKKSEGYTGTFSNIVIFCCQYSRMLVMTVLIVLTTNGAEKLDASPLVRHILRRDLCWWINSVHGDKEAPTKGSHFICRHSSWIIDRIDAEVWNSTARGMYVKSPQTYSRTTTRTVLPYSRVVHTSYPYMLRSYRIHCAVSRCTYVSIRR